MWFAGLLLGGLIGSFGGGGSAVLGALIGAVAGAFVGSALKSSARRGAAAPELGDIETKIDHIYKSLEDIHHRLVRLEKPDAQAAPGQQPAAPGTTAFPTAMDHVGRQAVSPMAANIERADSIFVAPVVTTETSAAPETPQSPQPPQSPVQPASPAIDAPPVVGRETATATPFADSTDSSATPFLEDDSWLHRLFRGNIVAKAGAVILFFGTCFLLKFAYDHAFIPVPLRLFGVAVLGIAMVAVGWRLLATRRLYALILQGAGVGVLYIDAYFALKVFALIHPTIGFTLFVLLGVVATVLAVRQDSKALAMLGLTGAFLAPVLASTHEGNHVMLFSYYTLLNGFILAISWFKAWRDLNVVGFLFTFIVGVLWGADNYRPELFATVEPFVLLFFATYLVIPILFATRQPPELKGLVDGMLVFGTPLSAAFMQSGLVRDLPYGLAWSAGCAAVLYAALAGLVLRREGMRLLGETYVALATVFATMAIFFALDAYPTFALWTLEGAAVVWVGLRQRRLLARLFGIALQFGGALLFLFHYAEYSRANPWFNDFVLGCALITLAGGITAWLMHKHREVLIEGGEGVATAILLWACGWWFAGGLHALHDGLPYLEFQPVALIFAAVSFAIMETLGGWLNWVSLRRITLAHLFAIMLGILTIGGRHPLAGQGAVAWPLNFIVFFWCLHWQAQDGIATVNGIRYRTGWLMLAAVATWEGLWLLGHHYYEWGATIGAAGIVAGWLRYHLRERGNAEAGRLSVWALLWGLAFWFGSGWAYIEDNKPLSLQIAYDLGYAVASCALFEIVGGWARWNALRRTELLLFAVMLAVAFMQLDRHMHPAADGGLLAWLSAFLVLYAIMYRQQKEGIAASTRFQHVVAVWLASGLIAWELAWQCADRNPITSWPFAMWGLVPALTLLLISHYGRRVWPWRDDFAFFRNTCLGVIAVFSVLWSVMSSWDPGNSAWRYMPILNPIDLAQISVLCGLRVWLNAGRQVAETREQSYPVLLAMLAFVWLNSAVLRTIHHWLGVPYVMHELFNSIVVQAAFSLLWTLTAMMAMVFATRRMERKLWFAGAALLAVVVGKLFLLDIANSGAVASIVSFLGVGALLMVIGYVAPVPPGDVEKQRG
ncbi:MAG: hypothetical protein JWN94_2818 [Betaproteobacteria bacterium]|nr:hypothetical protein [Betaproteobacteria bacterium]